jgi:DNA-binding MarR family transcriptional regulator
MTDEINNLMCTNLKVRQLNRMVTRLYDRFLAEAGLKNTQYALLSVVLRLGPVRPADLARAMEMEPSTLTRNLQPLIAHGWVSMRSGQDSRSKVVELTASGKTKREEGRQSWSMAQRELDTLLGTDRVNALHELLDECITRTSIHEPQADDQQVL